MTSFTLKNIPAPVYEALKRSAAENRRSINSEILTCLERAFRSQKMDTEEFLARAREVRASIGGGPFTLEEIQAAKEYGRL